MLVFRDWALMFVRGLKLPVRLGAYGIRGCIRGCVLRLLTSPSTWPLLNTQAFGVIKQQFPETAFFLVRSYISIGPRRYARASRLGPQLRDLC
ncbi:hypothetical protein NDU88_003667 [Pleurodeles waltl]|uniref:Secreted protein n=1 Tax=Pleurodeles waltl TaxID=8319 RepID=A0AAV7TQF1_PLEWA|nr:hypothetical protein NDU88_003667 [Pleurodeles waltl]